MYLINFCFLEDGVFLEDDLKVEVPNNPLIKNINCLWDKIKNKLSMYLYPVLLTRVAYPDKTKTKSFGARWDSSSKKWCVNFDNPNFQNGLLDVYLHYRNGEFFMNYLSVCL